MSAIVSWNHGARPAASDPVAAASSIETVVLKGQAAPGTPAGVVFEGFVGSPIMVLTVVAAPPAAAERGSARLALRLLRNYLVEAERRWELRECELFSFTRAELRELPR